MFKSNHHRGIAMNYDWSIMAVKYDDHFDIRVWASNVMCVVRLTK